MNHSYKCQKKAQSSDQASSTDSYYTFCSSILQVVILFLAFILFLFFLYILSMPYFLAFISLSKYFLGILMNV